MTDLRYKEFMNEMFKTENNRTFVTFVQEVEQVNGCRFYELDADVLLYHIHAKNLSLNTFIDLSYRLTYYYNMLIEQEQHETIKENEITYNVRAGVNLLTIESYIIAASSFLERSFTDAIDYIKYCQIAHYENGKMLRGRELLFVYLLLLGFEEKAILELNTDDVNLKKGTIDIMVYKYGKDDVSKKVRLNLLTISNKALLYAIQGKSFSNRLTEHLKIVPYSMLIRTLAIIQSIKSTGRNKSYLRLTQNIEIDMKYIKGLPLFDKRSTIVELSKIASNTFLNSDYKEYQYKKPNYLEFKKMSSLKRIELSDKDDRLFKFFKENIRQSIFSPNVQAALCLENTDMYISSNELKSTFYIYLSKRLKEEKKEQEERKKQ